jgi:hypothetical protein
MNKNILKTFLIFGGGLLVFLLVKNKLTKSTTTVSTPPILELLPPAPTKENIDVVMKAYTDAVKNGETAAKLTELNKECMKEFGLRCYLDKSGQPIVVDTKGDSVSIK